MADITKKQVDRNFALVIVIGLFLIVLSAAVLKYQASIFKFPISIPSFPQIPFVSEVEDIKKFSTEEEFKAYLQEAAELEYLGLGGVGGELAREISEAVPVPTMKKEAGAPERVSETTVQVPGIDEPDIVKTDGKEIYFSLKGYYWRRFMEAIPSEIKGETKVIKAFPPADLVVETKIDKSGDLLLTGDTLVIFSGQEIFGFDVSKPKSPKEEWKMELEGNSSLVAARLYKNKIYLVTKNRIDQTRPCPIKPLVVNGTSPIVKCQEIYHPVRPIPVDVTFIVMVLDPISGELEKKIAFVGSSGSSVVYMSERAIYVTYSYYESIIKFLSNFFKENQDIFPAWLIEKMEKLESYDISQSAKLVEFQVILQRYLSSLARDERLKIENELSNRMADYYKEHKRDLEKTGIVKIGLEEFVVKASGNVPGIPLNQFALDEYKTYLRIATTIGQRRGFGFPMVRGESANDVYVLDENLKIQGRLQDLGLTERIYSVRFIEDKGYLVTFRQTDPFYVLDLADPQKPELKGELKIPGYSSYLHPITKDKILGTGKEGWQVKISLFDVSQPKKPKELDKYILDESWSDVLSTHHAFLLDKRHSIFFLPGAKGGYIFGYRNDKLELVRAVSDISARRALYLNDYLYIISDNKITVLNEIDWQEVNELEL